MNTPTQPHEDPTSDKQPLLFFGRLMERMGQILLIPAMAQGTLSMIDRVVGKPEAVTQTMERFYHVPMAFMTAFVMGVSVLAVMNLLVQRKTIKEELKGDTGVFSKLKTAGLHTFGGVLLEAPASIRTSCPSTSPFIPEL